MKKIKNILLFALLGLSLSIFAFAPKAHASSFNAGRIIDDAIFTNKSAMSVGDIQNFLNSKVPTCDTWHTAGPSAQGATPPWTCLKNYHENTSTGANNLNGAAIPAGAISAAQIIYNAAQTYNINPQVLLVTLQKENGLITDDWPYPWQYRTAMGFACPDNGSCDPAYYGFSKQVNQAARHFRNFYDLNPNWYIPFRPGSNYIQYNPNAGCGGTNVNITNNATAALYSYTPYQPNAAALNNLYSTGDGCSAYGNRNFWRDFSNWFGSTLGNDYDYSFVGASDGSYIEFEPDQPRPGQFIKIRNTGNSTWYADGSTPAGVAPVRLMLKNYQNSPFADISDSNWLGTKNQIKMTTQTVKPGEVATFTFNLKGPYTFIRNYPNYFVPVVDGVKVMKDVGMRFITTSKVPSYGFVSATNTPSAFYGNQKASSTIILKNTGAVPWYADGAVPVGKKPTRITSINNAPTNFYDISNISWLGTRTKTIMSTPVVQPGENATFVINFAAPLGNYNEVYGFVPEIQDYSQFADIGMRLNLKTLPYSANYSFVGATGPPAIMSPGDIVNTQITLKNTGSIIWRNEDTRIRYGSTRIAMLGYGPSPFYNASDSNWLSPSQIKMTTPIAEPGQNAVFNFQWKAPTTKGTYNIRFAPVLDGYQWLPDIGMLYSVVVN